MNNDKQGQVEESLSIEQNVNEIAGLLEKARLKDYVDLMTNRKRRLFLSFIEGIARGFGMAIGFTILGALAIIFLRKIVLLNLPIIGDFIAEVVKIVQDNL